MPRKARLYSWYWVKVEFRVSPKDSISRIVDVIALRRNDIKGALDRRFTVPYRVEATMFMGTRADYCRLRQEQEWIWSGSNKEFVWDVVQRTGAETLPECLNSWPGL